MKLGDSLLYIKIFYYRSSEIVKRKKYFVLPFNERKKFSWIFYGHLFCIWSFTPWLWIDISSKKTASPIYMGTFHWKSIVQSSLQRITKSRAKLTQCQDLANQLVWRSANLSLRIENRILISFLASVRALECPTTVSSFLTVAAYLSIELNGFLTQINSLSVAVHTDW